LSKRRQHTHAASPAAPSNPPKAEAFTFGDAMPVMDRAEILDYVETWATGQWFEPPVSLAGLAKSFRPGVHHSSAIYFKRNVLSATFIPHKLLTREEFDK
jgi:capsid portal protein